MHTQTGDAEREGWMGVNIATQNVGGLGLEVRSHKRRGVTGPKLQYISQCVNLNKTELLVLTETRAKTIEESRNTYVKDESDNGNQQW
jgi:hypothetical protein